MRYLIKSFLLPAFLILIPSLAFAVSQKEMEQARTIATKAYLRYANDGSGYLDDIEASTMEELEANLKAKEKENIKAFKEIPVPSDYKEWDKDKLIQYWAVTAFQNSNLLEKGKGGRIRARAQINKMEIAESKPSSVSDVTPNTSDKTEDISSSPTSSSTSPDSGPQSEVNLQDIQNQEEAILDEEESIENQPDSIQKASSNAWVYIMVLCILVAIVIALVVYAANVMKKNNQKANENALRMPDQNLIDKIEHFESSIGDKNNEILMLSKKLESAYRLNAELKSQIEDLTAQIASLRASAGSQIVSSKPTSDSPRQIAKRSIFLGRANSKGIFVRADRSLNIGNSIFILETSDGFSGTFKVADSPAAWSLALSNPREYLENACSGFDLDNTSDVSKIVTETSGTAVFEGGCWRVIRKARIRYE